jgi:hypothetical protein
VNNLKQSAQTGKYILIQWKIVKLKVKLIRMININQKIIKKKRYNRWNRNWKMIRMVVSYQVANNKALISTFKYLMRSMAILYIIIKQSLKLLIKNIKSKD